MGHQAVHKKSMFPVQRLAKIVASRAAAIFSPHFNFLGRKILTIFGGKNEVSSRTFFLVTWPLRNQNYLYGQPQVVCVYTSCVVILIALFLCCYGLYHGCMDQFDYLSYMKSSSDST